MSSAPQLRLTYYPFGGRAAVARLCLAHGGIDFEDVRMPGEALDEAMRDTARFPLATVPVLEIDGGKVVLSQSDAISSYCARLAGLYPSDPLQAADVEEIQAQLEDFFQSLYATVGKEGDALKQAREEWLENTGKKHLKRLDDIFARGSADGPFLHGAKPAKGDFAIFSTSGHLASGQLDYIPKDLIAGYPRLSQAVGAVAQLPSVQAFLAKNPYL